MAEEKLKLYETIALYHPDLNEEGMSERVGKIEGVVSEHGGHMASVNRWKKRRLAYPVKKSTEGLYVVYRFAADKKALPDLDYMLRYDDRCLRYLIIDVAQFPGMLRTAKKKGEDK